MHVVLGRAMAGMVLSCCLSEQARESSELRPDTCGSRDRILLLENHRVCLLKSSPKKESTGAHISLYLSHTHTYTHTSHADPLR